MASNFIKEENDGQETLPFPLPAEVIEDIFDKIHSIDLASSAAGVSRSWRSAASSALRRRPHYPLLLITLVNRRSGKPSSACHAFDPVSRSWSELRSPATATWQVGPAPIVWRRDPVVAVVGRRIILAGGVAPELSDNPCSVDARSLDDSDAPWKPCEPMPAEFKDSASATWASSAVAGGKLYIADRTTGLLTWYEPTKDKWAPPKSIRHMDNSAATRWEITRGCSEEEIVLAGAGPRGAKLWQLEVRHEDGLLNVKKVSVIPMEVLRKLTWEEEEEEMLPSIGLKGGGGGWVYVYKREEPREAVAVCELSVRRWDVVSIPEELHGNAAYRAVIDCAVVDTCV